MADAAKNQRPTVGETTLSALVALQQDYAVKIATATSRGDVAQVQLLIAEMTAKIQELARVNAGPQLTLVKGSERQLFDGTQCAINLDLTAYDGDREGLVGLLNDEALQKKIEELLQQGHPDQTRRDLLKSGFRLTPRLAPTLFEVLQQCKDNTGLGAEFELYLCPDTRVDVFCLAAAEGRLVVGVTSSMLELLQPDELTFVVGRAIGQMLFAHQRVPVQYLMTHGWGRWTAVQALRLHAWRRCADISADRIGLLCGRDFDAASRAFFKLGTGIGGEHFTFQIRDYVQEFCQPQIDMGQIEADPETWFSAHAFGPARLRALDMFHRSEAYLKLVDKPGAAELSEEQLDFEIKKFMTYMEPSYLQDASEHAPLMREFVFLGAWLLAAAEGDGPVNDAQFEGLASLLEPAEAESRLQAMTALDREGVKNQVIEIAGQLTLEAPMVSKLNVLKDLCVVAVAGGGVEKAKLDVLYALCNALNIRPQFIDQSLFAAASN